MRPLSSLSDGLSSIAIDASIAINLNATRAAQSIVRAIPYQLWVPEIVLEELRTGVSKGRTDYAQTMELVEARLLKVANLNEVGWRHFEDLTIGSSATTLDDGEAAAIAIALQNNFIVAIDERKALKTCELLYQKLQLATTMDILALPHVENALGRSFLSDAVFWALHDARMRVVPRFVPWVIKIVGQDRAQRCLSLPKAVRIARTV